MPYDIDNGGMLDECHFDTCEPHKRWLKRRYAKMFPAKDPDLTFRVRGLPPRRTAQQKGYCRDDKVPGGVRVFTKPEVRKEAADMIGEFRRQLPEGWIPRGGAARCRVDLSYAARAIDRLPGDLYLPHTERPDVDNLVKAILDAMTRAGVWKDDAQVWLLTVSKVRRTSPRWTIRVWFDGKAERRGADAEQGQFDFRG